MNQIRMKAKDRPPYHLRGHRILVEISIRVRGLRPIQMQTPNRNITKYLIGKPVVVCVPFGPLSGTQHLDIVTRGLEATG